MILNLEKKEIEELLKNLLICRDNVKKTFKKRYKKPEYKDLMATYESVLVILAENREFEAITIELDDKQAGLIKSFLEWFIKELTQKQTAELLEHHEKVIPLVSFNNKINEAS